MMESWNNAKKKTAGVASGYAVPRKTGDRRQNKSRNDGGLKNWSIGVMEYWSTATTKSLQPITPLLHHSSTPNS
jgi:hypothetical protein